MPDATAPNDPTPPTTPAARDAGRRAAMADALWSVSPDCLKRLDLDGNVLRVNDAGRRLLGLDDGGPPPPACWFGWWDDAERAKVERAVADARAGRAADFDAWATGRDGGVRCWSIRVVPVPGPDGRPVELVASSRDITEACAQAALAAVHAPANDPPLVPADVADRPHLKDYAIFSLDAGGVVSGWGAGARALFGWEAEEIIGRPGDPLWTPEDRAAGVPAREMAAAGRDGVARDRRWHLRRDGSRVFVDGAMLARHDTDGRPAGFVKVGRDDTRRRRTEDELDAVRRRLDSALIAGEVGTFDWNLVTDRIRGDANFQRIFGVAIPPGDTLPITILFDVLHPDDLPETLAAIRGTIGRGEPYKTEYRVRHADGDVRWVLARGQVDRDAATGVATRFTGVILDVTDRKRAEAERQASADQRERQAREYDTILSATDDFAYIFDLEGRILYANRRLLEVWGVALEDAVGLTLVELGYPIWHAAMHRREIDDVIRTRRPIRGEVPFVGGSGQGGVYDYIFSPVIGPDGRVERVVGTTRDVTSRRAVDDARRMAEGRERFLAELGEATRDLADPAAVVAAVSQRLGEHLGASRVAYADVAADGDAFVIHPDYCDLGVASCAGSYTLNAFGTRAAMLMRAGRTLVVRDTARELTGDDADPTGAATFEAIDIRAIICCPLVRGGRLVAMMAVHQRNARDWTHGDVALVETAVERTWSYVERSRGLRELAESEARFRHLADAMPQIVWTARPDGHVEYYNGRWYDYTGIAAGTEGDASWAPVLLPDDAARVRDAWARSLATGEPYEVECRLRGRDGVYRWHLGRALPVRDASGAIVRWYGTNTDIHEGKVIAAALAESESRFRQLADAMPQIVWASRPDGTIDYYNRRWFEYTGLPEDGASGDRSWEPMLLDAELPAIHAAWQAALASGEPYEMRYRVRRASDGEYRWHLARALAARDATGTVIRWYGTNTDIHDQTLADVALAESEARFRQLADAMPQIVWAAAADGTVDYYNRRWFEYTGLPDDGTRGDASWLPTVLPEDVARTAPMWAESLRLGTRLEFECRYRRHDGAYRWHLCRAEPVRDAAGRVVRWYATNTDIHDQKMTEVALAEGEARFRQLADAMPQIVFAARPDGTVDYFNRRWYEYTGIDAATPSEQWQQVHTPDGLARVTEAWPHAIASGEPYEIEYPLRRRDGAYRWHLGRALPVRDAAGTVIRWYGTNTDIHDQKMSEAALAADKAALERIAAGAPLAEILSVLARGVEAQGGAEGAVCSILVADAASRTLRNGASPGLPASFAREVEGSPIAPLTGACGTAAYRGQTVHIADTRTDENWAAYQDHARKYELAAATSMPIPQADGTVAGTVCIYYRTPQPGTPSARDLELLRTAVHIAGIAIERDRAETAVRDALADATRARAAAEHASRMKDEFLATLSHELRTPMSAILGWSQMLRRPSLKPGAMTQGLDTIERNARAQTQIIEDLLDMSRIISGKVALDPRRVDLAAVLAAAVETVRPTAQGKGVDIEIDAGPAPIVADANRLQQVFWNLLTNAVKFTPRGGHVRVSLDRDGSQWRASVTDTGEGIASDFLPFVFDRFRQADASITRRHGGLGLGLAIVKQIVELHGGRVGVASDGPGRGATFTVRLPLPATASDASPANELPVATPNATASSTATGRTEAQVAPVPAAPTWDPVAAQRLAGIHVLVVDDEPDARGLLRHLLETCGATIVEAGSAEAAIAALAGDTRRPDVIVSDVGMPGENGYSMLARARALDARIASIPAVALTAYARAEDRVAALRAGFQMHVPKPVEPAELIATIASLIDRR